MWIDRKEEDYQTLILADQYRALEMMTTQEQAKLLTQPVERGGTHHLAHFIPKDVLQSFEQQRQKSGKSQLLSGVEDDATNKIDQSNIGFRMLQKQGWTMGSGLGKNGTGVTAPVRYFHFSCELFEGR